MCVCVGGHVNVTLWGLKLVVLILWGDCYKIQSVNAVEKLKMPEVLYFVWLLMVQFRTGWVLGVIVGVRVMPVELNGRSPQRSNQFWACAFTFVLTACFVSLFLCIISFASSPPSSSPVSRITFVLFEYDTTFSLHAVSWDCCQSVLMTPPCGSTALCCLTPQCIFNKAVILHCMYSPPLSRCPSVFLPY